MCQNCQKTNSSQPRNGKKLTKRKNCELCKAEELTERFYTCKDYWIAKCKTCGDMIVVFSYHIKPCEDLIKTMTTHLVVKTENILEVQYKNMELDINAEPHWNCHARIKGE